jgi:hypothetical protein
MGSYGFLRDDLVPDLGVEPVFTALDLLRVLNSAGHM